MVNYKKAVLLIGGTAHIVPKSRLQALDCRFVGDGQFFAAFGSARCENLATVGGSHSLAESVFVDPLFA
jgi:hypothetical protein